MEHTGFFQSLKTGLSKTHHGLVGGLDRLFSGKSQIDQDLMDQLEEILITADLGVRTVSRLLEEIERVKKPKAGASPEGIKVLLQDHILRILKGAEQRVSLDRKPFVFMVVGVNGVGKTSVIGKLAHHYKNRAPQTLFAAADTFRAAAVEVHAARARSADLLFIDTAGRLHTQVNLMEELKKIKRIVQREYPEAPHETLLVLDATTGQNAISQARMFHEAFGITGITLTKLDGTAKGGIIVSICHDLGIPIRYVGVGEGLNDLHPFDADQFVHALFD